MKTSVAKAKGRVLQNKVRDLYRILGNCRGLEDGDIESRPMGQNGVDIILSPAAKKLFNHSIECKKHAAVKIPAEFKKHHQKYKDDGSLVLLYSENNRDQPLVTMKAEEFLGIIDNLLTWEHKAKLFAEKIIYQEQNMKVKL